MGWELNVFMNAEEKYFITKKNSGWYILYIGKFLIFFNITLKEFTRLYVTNVKNYYF